MIAVTSNATKQLSIRVAAALVVGMAIATLVPFFHHWIPLWIWRVVIFSVVAWWVLPRVVPGWRRAAGISARKPVDISAGEIVNGREWFVVRTRPAPLPKRLVVIGVFFGLLASFFGVLLTPPHSAFVGDGASNLAVFLVVSLPAGIWVIRWLANRTRKLVTAPFAMSSDAVRLPNGDVIPRDQIDQVALRNTQQQGALIIGGAGIQGATLLAQQESRQRLAEVSHAVMVEHGGQVSMLAAGLTFPQADAVFKAVNKHLGFG